LNFLLCGLSALSVSSVYLTLSPHRRRWSSQGAARQGGDFPLGKYDPVLDRGAGNGIP